jgi:hypothetical protein
MAREIPAKEASLQPLALGPPPHLSSEDFYMEGPFVVFTAAYHLRRGYCCHSNCRHCPYTALGE